jgi:HD-GYP domain-containing protein (c-di-GMP phosphodiesterase class II)
VAELAAALARAHGLPEEMVEQVRMAGIVHDVGKIGVPEAVLCKTGRLTPEEFEQIKQHPEIGYQILKDIPHFQDLLPGVLSHHERYDGRGYPQGLAGDRIPLMARIIGLVDSFDAMSSNRTYRSAMPRGRVFEELAEHAGKQFDPGLVESFNKVDLSLYDELVELHQSEAVEGGLRIRRRRAAA